MIVVIFVALVLGARYLNKSATTATVVQNENARVEISEKSYDWGEIQINEGAVERVFEIKNTGSGELSLSNISTSCMCTTAQLILGDESSPEFGMHTKSSYVMNVPEGQTAQLKVVFDPAFHGPSGVGPINRQIKVETNDPSTPELNFMLTAIVRS